MKDLYRTLGVSPGASSSEIKSAYKKLARACHPDVSASPDANEKFARINEAYHVLINPSRRRAYDQGELLEKDRTFYASRAAEVVAIQREFDKLHDEDLASFRQETAARSHAVMVVVPLFVSTFYVVVVKPPIIEQLSLLGKIVIVALALYGLFYLVKNVGLVLKQFTYDMPDRMTSVFQPEPRRDKSISRRAGLIFLASGYLVSVGLGYVVSVLIPISGRLSTSVVIGILLYPPITVLAIASLRRLVNFLERS
jgi:DnaJ-domain-containing protein 1